jgi:hypothetical protein
MTVTRKRWVGHCLGCNRDREVESRSTHAERVLCDECAAKPHRPPTASVEDLAREVTAEVARLAKTNGKGGPVAHTPGPGPVGHPNGRYDGRILDVAAMLAQPDEPIPWRCDNLTADGYLSVLAGRGGEGKSWLALTLACGVARGATAAGIPCKKGRAVLFDAENGPKLTIRRFRAAGVADLLVQPVDAGGLKITTDIGWFKATIEDQKANLVVFDSLRVLSSGAKENDSDVMEPIITALKQLARDTGAAVLLIHHRGKSVESDYRGTSVIGDQTDMMFRLERVKGDPNGRTRRKITTLKCRIEEEPEPRWVQITTDRAQGLVTVDAAEPYEDEDSRPRDSHRAEVLGALGGIGRSERNIAKATGVPRTTVQRILDDLDAEGLAARNADGWVAHEGGPPPMALQGGPPGPPPENGSTKPDQSGPPQLGHLGHPTCSCVTPADLTEDGRCSRCWGWPQ